MQPIDFDKAYASFLFQQRKIWNRDSKIMKFLDDLSGGNRLCWSDGEENVAMVKEIVDFNFCLILLLIINE